MTKYFLLAVLSLLLFNAGCGLGSGPIGLLYTDVTQPFTVNMNNTPNPGESKTSKASSQRISEPITGLDIRVEFNSTAFGDAMKKGEIDTIYYADLRRQSVLLGIWQKNTVILRGRSSVSSSGASSKGASPQGDLEQSQENTNSEE